MSFRIHQKIGKHVYVYEVSAYWDKNKKQARQRRQYIGKLDKKTETVVACRSTKPKASFDFGDVYFIEQLFEKCGLKEVLCRHYEEGETHLFQLCAYQVSEGSAMRLCDDWATSTARFYDSKISSQKISKILHRIGSDEATQQAFFADWISNNRQAEGIFFDITSFSSYSKQCDIVEWGYNRDDEELPQINFGLIQSYPASIPLFYRVYSGSIPDVTTITNMRRYLDEYKITNVTLVLDRGFYSQQNLLNIYDTFHNFTIPLPFSTKLSDELLTGTGNFVSSKNLKTIGHRQVFCVTKPISIASKQLIAHIYFDEFRRASQLGNFAPKLDALEAKSSDKKFSSESEVLTYLDEEFQAYKKYYSAIQDTTGHFRVERNNTVVDKTLAKMGKMIIITKHNSDASEILRLYRSKDSIEKCFDAIKNDLSAKRLHVQSDPTVLGRLFISFLSIVLHTSIMKTIKGNKALRNYSVKELLRELRKIKAVQLQSGKVFLTEITKKQRTIFEDFSIEIPTAAKNIVIKKGGI